MEPHTDTASPFNIVVGFDFSDEAHLALDHALAIAGDRSPSFVHVLGVLETGITTHPSHQDAKIAHDRIAQIAETMRTTRDLDEVTLFAHARIGAPAHSITLLASEVDADLVVVGTHGRTGVERWLLGSVAERVVRTAPCPVMAVRPRQNVQDEDTSTLRPEPPCPDCVAFRRSSGGRRWWCDEHRGQQIEPTILPAKHDAQMHPVRGVAEVKATAPFGPKPSALERAGRS